MVNVFDQINEISIIFRAKIISIYRHALCTVHYFTLILIYILLAIALANPLYIGVKFTPISISVIYDVKFRAGNATIILHREQRQRVSACVTRTSGYTRQQATIRPPQNLVTLPATSVASAQLSRNNKTPL